MKKGDLIATRTAYGKALVELGRENRDVVVLDADLAKSTKTADFAKEFPERFFDMGIAEQDMMATAAGLAAAGKIPFASTFAVFATGRAYDQVRNSIAYPALNVKIAATHAGLTVGEDGASHQSLEDIALMRAVPHMTVLVPADAIETEAAVRAAAAFHGPVYIRLGRPEVPVLYGDGEASDGDGGAAGGAGYRFEIGRASRLREGRDVAIIATGVMVAPALDAANMLAQGGIEARVINMATIKPIDRAEIRAAALEAGAIVTAEEHSVVGGLGSAVAEVVVALAPVPVEMLGVADRFGQSGAPGELLAAYGLTAEGIVKAARRVLERKRR